MGHGIEGSAEAHLTLRPVGASVGTVGSLARRKGLSPVQTKGGQGLGRCESGVQGFAEKAMETMGPWLGMGVPEGVGAFFG